MANDRSREFYAARSARMRAGVGQAVAAQQCAEESPGSIGQSAR